MAKFFAWIWPATAQRLLAVLYAVVGLVACFVPLFNLVGYESAALFAVLGGFGAVFSTHWVWSQLSLAGVTSAMRTVPVSSEFVRLYLQHLTALAVPLLLLTLNAIRVTNCEPWVGFGFWALLVLPSVAVGQTYAFVAIALGPKSKWLRRGVSVGLVGASVAWFGALLALQPPITGFQVFLGYFSGSIYDEALSIPMSLVVYRGLCALAVVAVLAALQARWRANTSAPIAPACAVAILAGVVFLAGWTTRSDVGIDLHRETIQEVLGGHIETEHFVIYFPADARFRVVADQMADDHEFRYQQMVEFFGLDPVEISGKKVISYVYPDRNVKGRLMGGRRTLVAKLWLGEMHILWRRPGDHLLAHELAHIFTKPFGTGPLSLSTRWGVGVNMGLVEGIATAADWPTGQMSPHEASTALRRLEIAPDIRKMLGASGFWTQSSGLAYTLMGSFIRFLRDEYGIEKVRQAYGHGEFEAAFGKPVETLVNEWEAFVDTVEVSESDMARASYVFAKRSIFQKTCARVIAEWRREAQEAQTSSNIEAADALFQRIIGYDPNPRNRLEYAAFLMRAQRLEAALQQANFVLEAKQGPAFEAQARQLMGDVLWMKANPEGAEEQYTKCLELGVPIDLERLISAKRQTLETTRGSTEALALDYFLRKPDSDVSLFFPADWVRRNPHHAIANYLLGRRLWSASEFERSLEFLEQARNNTGAHVLDWETEMMLGQGLYWLGRLAEARAVFKRLAEAAKESSPYRHAAHEWANRVDWREARNRVENR